MLEILRNGEKPLFMGRIGHTENYVMIDDEFINAGFQRDYSSKSYHDAKNCSGIYPATKEGLSICARYQKEAIRSLTHFVFWHLKMEPYWIKHYLSPNAELLDGYDLFRIMGSLKGKKVLVVSAFVKTIERQYEKRKVLFPDETYLPDFQLLLEKSPVTFADIEPELPSWEESLLECFARCQKHEFDVALIGAGSYSLPLGHLLFQLGKQVIVLNSNIQIAFGIRGRRWDTQPWAGPIRALYNEHWVYPAEDETPEGFQKVDPGSGYWG